MGLTDYSRNSTVNAFSRLSIDLCDVTTVSFSLKVRHGERSTSAISQSLTGRLALIG